MKHHLPPLDGLKAFESAARHLSFSLAADELCITKGAVSYQIRKLEAHLQCALFKRSVRQVFLTESGQMLLQSTQSLFSGLEDVIERLQGDQQQSAVTVAATTYVAARWLSQHISTFNAQFPQVSVLLQHSVNSADFKLADVDLAIRWGPIRNKPDRNRFAELPMPLYPVVSPQLLEQHAPDFDTNNKNHCILDKNFARIPLLCEDRQQDLWQEWLDASSKGQPSLALPNPRRVISDANVRVQAAIDGQGFILADELMLNEINNHLLTAPFTDTLTGYGYAFLQSASHINGDNTEAFKRWLADQTRT